VTVSGHFLKIYLERLALFFLTSYRRLVANISNAVWFVPFFCIIINLIFMNILYLIKKKCANRLKAILLIKCKLELSNNLSN